MTTTATTTDDETISKQLQQLRTQLNKKQTFESSVSSIKSLLLHSYVSSSPSTKKLFYDVVSRVATVLRTRYTAPGFLLAGADLIDTAARLSSDPAEKSHLSSLRQSLVLHQDDSSPPQPRRDGGGYLFEGHLTVDAEPPQPNWLVQQNLLAALASQSSTTTAADGSNGGDNGDNMGSLLRALVESQDAIMMEGLEELLLAGADVPTRRAAPPASREVVEKLSVIKIDDAVMEKVGEDAECCICKEKLGLGDEMQEMPCEHLFHPLCLKPWLDEHNSCPICRHELPTDDHKYESWKEREKELEEERRGAANAIRGGEFMYI